MKEQDMQAPQKGSVESGRSPRPGSSWPAWPGAPARSAPTASARVVDAFVVEDLPMPEDRGDCGMGGTLL